MSATATPQVMESGSSAGYSDPCVDCQVRQYTFCGPLDREEVQQLKSILTSSQYSSGETLVLEGEASEHVFNITAGAVKLYKLLPDGRRSITGFLFPGDFLGIAKAGEYAYSAEALMPTLTCRFPRKRLESLSADLPKIEHRLLELAFDELAAAQDQMVLLGRKSAAEKIASFLRSLSDRQQRRKLPANPVVLPMNRSDIADFLGLTTETVSRTFTQLKTSGVISLRNGGMVEISNPDALEELAEGV